MVENILDTFVDAFSQLMWAFLGIDKTKQNLAFFLKNNLNNILHSI
jgi:hypothetical protein